MANDVKLQEGQVPLDEHLRPLKVGGETSSVEIAKHGSGIGMKVTGDLEVTGTSPSDDTKLPLAGGTMTGDIATASDFTLDVGGDLTLDASGGDIKLETSGNTSINIDCGVSPAIRIFESAGGTDYCDIATASSGATTISTVDAAGADADFTLDIDGDIKIGCNSGGSITLQENDASVYTPTATSDATTKAYVDTKYFFSQTMNFYSPATDHDVEWIICNNETFFKLGGTDETVTNTETATISQANQGIARSLWFIAPYNMTITHISGSIMDDDIDAHPSGNYKLGIWSVGSFGTSGSTPTAKTGSQTFTLEYITATVSGTEDDDTAYVFYDASPSLTLSAGDGIWVGYLNTRSALGDASTVQMSIWGYAT